jgi:hypothetical protein
MSTDQGGWLFMVITVIGVIALAGALFYGVSMWRNKRIDPATERASREATERLYHHEDAEAEAAAEGRPDAARPPVDTAAPPT